MDKLFLVLHSQNRFSGWRYARRTKSKSWLGRTYHWSTMINCCSSCIRHWIIVTFLVITTHSSWKRYWHRSLRNNSPWWRGCDSNWSRWLSSWWSISSYISCWWGRSLGFTPHRWMTSILILRPSSRDWLWIESTNWL